MEVLPQADDMETVLRNAATRSNPQLLRSGVVPNDDCSAGITGELHAMVRIHTNIQREINDLVLQLAHAVGRRSEVERQQAASRAMLSPVRRMPPEVMSRMFEFATPDDWTRALLGTRSLNFAAVCKVWHTIALETPQLWNSFSIDFREDPMRWQDAFDLRVARSGQVPLQLCFAFDHTGLPSWGAYEWDWLSSQSHRWAALAIHNLPSSVQGARWQPTWPKNMPALATLEIAADSSKSPSFREFEDAPVNSLKLQYTATPRAVPALPPTWRITDLTIDCQHGKVDVDLTPFLHVITTCSSTLQRLDVAAVRLKETTTSLPAGTVFPALESVKLSYQACCLLDRMAIPHLASISLHGHAGVGREKDVRLLECFVEMLSQSSAENREHLHSLTLVDFASATGTIIQCLDLLPALASLDIVKSGSGCEGVPSIASRSLLCALTRDPTEGRTMDRLPQLRRIGLRLGWPEERVYDKTDLLKEVIVSRTKECEYEGKELMRLEKFETDLPGNWELSGALEC